MEENKENDLQPPLPQSYAATVARQSSVPSTSTMPGKHHVCPFLSQKQNSHLGQSGKSPNLQGFTQKHHVCSADWSSRILELTRFISCPPKQARNVLLCFLGSLASAAPPCTANGLGSGVVATSKLHRLSGSSCCRAGFQELKLWV